MTDLVLPTSTDQTRPWSNRITAAFTLETVLWGILILIAIWTRFWDLGERTQHHDESLHTYYSWIFSTGDRLYVHNPLMHGPFLFHANALIYKLFGATDTTSRLVPAAFGVAIVWLPWLLRSPRMLGRWGALAAGYLLLISPGMLYYTRYIRHDPYMVAGCLLLAIAIFRYMEFPQRRWIIIAFASVSFLLTNHELVLATFLIFTVVLWGSLLLTHLRALIPVHIGAMLLLAVSAYLWLDQPFPPIPWSRPAANALTSDQFFTFLRVGGPVVLTLIGILVAIATIRDTRIATIIGVALVGFSVGWLAIAQNWIPAVRSWEELPENELSGYLTTSEFYWALFQHPFVQALLITAAVFIIGCAITLRWMLRDMPDEDNGIDYVLGDSEPNTVAYGVRHALHDPMGVIIGISVAIVIWVLLFTTFFTNPNGIGTGTYETNSTLLYWLGQHDVQRGNQPWFYFITLGLQYEWLAYLLGGAGTLLVSWRLLRWVAGKDAGPNLLWNVFIVAWFVGMFLVLSWAGEKMPWLIIHIVLPGALIAGWLTNSVIERGLGWYRRQPESQYRNSGLAVAGLLIALAGGWFFTSARLTYGEWQFTEIGQWVRSIPVSAQNDWWFIAIPPLLALFVIAAAVWTIGPRKTMYATLAAAFTLMSLFQVSTGVRMSYIDGDLAVDTMIYNTISHDMTQFTQDMATLSQMVHGDNSIEIVYDQCKMQWPTNWYLKRDTFPNARFTSYASAGNPDVILVANDSQGCGWPDSIPGYTKQVYNLRVHERETSVYRRFAIAPEVPVGWSAWVSVEDPHGLGAIVGSVGDSVMFLTTQEGQQKIFRLVMFRDQVETQQTYTMYVWIRDDLMPAYNEIRYGSELP
ncbi:MAG: TIGR03663 family protein [Thermomicrobiales bacterium]|nr:TIGR03663 family protein [Thermomicrobiales bacterium]MCO5225049.1 TIGR03663 family protein [Thermomicrobiales bacterium]